MALLRVPVISSVGHHTDRTLIDDVAAVSCSTPTHAAEAAVPVDCAAARRALAASAERLRDHGRRAILARARALAALSRAPAQHVARHRGRLHQLLRELRASARRHSDAGRSARHPPRHHAGALRRPGRRGRPRPRPDEDGATAVVAQLCGSAGEYPACGDAIDGTAASAAWVGVEQDTAATSSISVRSVWWPTEEITGTRSSATVRHNASSQKA